MSSAEAQKIVAACRCTTEKWLKDEFSQYNKLDNLSICMKIFLDDLLENISERGARAGLSDVEVAAVVENCEGFLWKETHPRLWKRLLAVENDESKRALAQSRVDGSFV